MIRFKHTHTGLYVSGPYQIHKVPPGDRDQFSPVPRRTVWCLLYRDAILSHHLSLGAARYFANKHFAEAQPEGGAA